MDDGRRDWDSLPDKILIHILSFLDTKEAVQSTLISKRWVNLWTSLPTLDFICNDRNDVISSEFVDKVLTLRDESSLIESLTFIQYLTVKTQLLQRVLSYAFSHGVQHLDILTPNLEGDDRLCWISSTSTLLTLYLVIPYITFSYPQENNACFGNLVTLYLGEATLESSDPFSGCPNLVDLDLINCLIDVKVFVVSGSRLLNLTITSYGAFKCDELVILSSRLTFIKIEGLQPICTSFPSNDDDGLPQFNEIYFDSLDTQGLSNERKQKLHSNMTKMLRSLHKAKFVTLSVTTAEILAYDRHMLAQEEFPFCNLKSLTIVSSCYILRKTFKLPLFVIHYFTRSSPQAEVDIRYPRSRLPEI